MLGVQDSLRRSSVKLGTIQRILAWPLRKDDTHTSRSVNNEVGKGARRQALLFGRGDDTVGTPHRAQIP